MKIFLVALLSISMALPLGLKATSYDCGNWGTMNCSSQGSSSCGNSFSQGCGNSAGQTLGSASTVILVSAAVAALIVGAAYLVCHDRGGKSKDEAKADPDASISFAAVDADLLPSRSMAVPAQ